jgi:hypothetical protein
VEDTTTPTTPTLVTSAEPIPQEKVQVEESSKKSTTYESHDLSSILNEVDDNDDVDDENSKEELATTASGLERNNSTAYETDENNDLFESLFSSN